MSFNFSSYEIVLAITFLFIIILTKYTNKIRMPLVISVIAIAILGFFFNPIRALMKNGDYTDLYRYFYDLDLLNQGILFSDSRLLTNYNVLPVMKIIVFIIAKTGINNFLPFIVCIIYYGCFAKILIKLYKKDMIKLSIVQMAFIFFILLSNFQLVITNIRVPLGSALFALILYYDLVEKVSLRKCIIPYLLLIGIHPFFIMLTILRLIYSFNNKLTNKFIYIILLLYCFSFTGIINFISNLAPNTYLNFLLDKADFYTNGSANQFFDRNNFIIDITRIISSFIFILYIKIIKKKNSINIERFNKLENFCMICSILAIGSLWNMTIFNRVGNFMVFVVIFLYVIYNQYKQETNNERKKSTVLLPNLLFYILVTMQSCLLFFRISISNTMFLMKGKEKVGNGIK